MKALKYSLNYLLNKKGGIKTYKNSSIKEEGKMYIERQQTVCDILIRESKFPEKLRYIVVVIQC